MPKYFTKEKRLYTKSMHRPIDDDAGRLLVKLSGLKNKGHRFESQCSASMANELELERKSFEGRRAKTVTHDV